jgi:hypothetical protein
MGSGMFTGIRIADSDLNFLPIPNPGSVSEILISTDFHCLMYGIVCLHGQLKNL